MIQFKLLEKQKELSRMKQRSAINLSMAEMWKLCGIYRKISDFYGAVCFRKNVDKLVKHWFIATNLSRKESSLSFNAMTAHLKKKSIQRKSC